MSRNGCDEPGETRIVTKHASQGSDVLGERVVPHNGLTSDGTQELVLVDATSGAPHQRDERVGCLGREDDQFAVSVKTAQPPVEPVLFKVIIDRRFSG